MTEGVPATYQPMVDWLAEPAPSFAGDTHALFFALINMETPGHAYAYEGFTFFKQNPQVGHLQHHHIEGLGQVVGNAAYIMSAQRESLPSGAPGEVTFPIDWVRVAISLHDPPLLSLDFLRSSGTSIVSDDLAYSLEYDLPSEPTPDGRGWFISLDHSETHAQQWEFKLIRTNLLFQLG